MIGIFVKKLQSRQSLKLEIRDINTDRLEISKIIENNNSLFFDKFSENSISRAINSLNPNAKYDYDISRYMNDDTLFIEIKIGDDLLYLTRETYNER